MKEKSISEEKNNAENSYYNSCNSDAYTGT